MLGFQQANLICACTCSSGLQLLKCMLSIMHLITVFGLHDLGVSITPSEFTVGRSSSAVCTSDAPATRMEWLANGRVVESALSTQSLDLIIELVNDSIHNDVFVCRVTREDGRMATRNFTIDVVGM